MLRFFYCQAVVGKKVSDRLRFRAQVLRTEPPTQRLIAQGGLFDLLDQNGDRLGVRGLSASCAYRGTSLPLCRSNVRIRVVVHEASLCFRPPELWVIGKRREE